MGLTIPQVIFNVVWDVVLTILFFVVANMVESRMQTVEQYFNSRWVY